MEGSPIVDPLACRHLYVLVSSKEKHTVAAMWAPWHAFYGVAPLVPCGANNHLLRDGHLSFTRNLARYCAFQRLLRRDSCDPPVVLNRLNEPLEVL